MRNKPCLTSDDAHKMMAACKAEAQKNKWNVAIAIVDDSGAALLLERLDGTGAIASHVAMGKAMTAAVTKRPTKFFEDRVKERPAFVTFPTPGVMFQGGAAGPSGRMRRRDRRVRRAVARGRADRPGRRRRWVERTTRRHSGLPAGRSIPLLTGTSPVRRLTRYGAPKPKPSAPPPGTAPPP